MGSHLVFVLVLDRCMLAQTSWSDCFILVHLARRWLAEKGELGSLDGVGMRLFDAPTSTGIGRIANAVNGPSAASGGLGLLVSLEPD